MRIRTALTALLLIGATAASAQAQKSITAATYADPTSAYPHGVLGDEEEWATLEIVVRSERGKEGGLLHAYLNTTYRIAALEDMVYEDTAPRLWDVTGDGLPEVVVVASHQQYGAQLVIIGLVDGELNYIATTPTIGTRFRWLAPVGAADFDGDGHIEVAFVDRPHLAKTLRIWRYTPEAFTEVATQPGLTNHKIGEDFITGGVRTCGSQPEIIVADAGWRNIMAARLGPDGITTEVLAPFNGTESVTRVLDCG